jgi:hypothetical protein
MLNEYSVVVFYYSMGFVEYSIFLSGFFGTQILRMQGFLRIFLLHSFQLLAMTETLLKKNIFIDIKNCINKI